MGGGSDIDGRAPDAAMPAARPRLDWLDALKGLGIIAVVAGHVWTRGPVRDAIYTVHMPLFFILSGYTARHVPWRQFVPRLSRTLLVPFLCFSVLLLGADFLIEGIRGVRPIFPSWKAGASAILFATDTLRGPFTILWFIPCLFLARLGWNALGRSGRNPDDRVVLIAIVIIFLLSLAAQYWGQGSPLGLRAAPGALLLIWMGALWRFWMQPQPRATILLMAVVLITLLWLPPINMKAGYVGWPILSLTGAGAVTIMLALVLQHLPSVPIRVLASFGRASLIIMYIHVAFIHYLAPYAPKAALLPLALGGAWILDWTVRRTKPTRMILLGETGTRN